LLIRRVAAQEQQGILEGYSTTGRTDRVAAFRVVGDYPLVVVAATDHSAIVGGWRRDVAVLAGLTFPTALALAWVAYVALRRTQREFAVSARLQQETAHRERVEDALRHSQKLEAMGRLTGGVAHDFNNLLAVVNNNVFLIRRQHPQVGQEAPLASIERAVGAGVKLTRQLLAFSRHQPLAPRSIRLQQALPALRDLLRSAVGGAVELKVEVDADTAPIVVDVAEFELAVLNLSVNAKDAMPSGGKLSIHASNDGAATAPSVRIDVTDTGTGIAPEIRDRIFEPFFTTKSAGHGTGLGLAQVWGLCRSAGGRVELASEPGRGSRFTMHFPAAAPEQAPVVADKRDDVAAAAAPLNCELLLVEDNQAVARAMIDVLEALGCRVQHRSNGDQALTLLASRKELHTPVDIVLSDITMPGAIDGVALGDWIQRTDPTLGVVLMTGYSHQIDDALQQRFDVLAKPFTPEELRSVLSRALGRSRARATADAAAALQHAAPAP
jgi:signal transduction histidine kinase/CheY-like chemotaxis protein